MKVYLSSSVVLLLLFGCQIRPKELELPPGDRYCSFDLFSRTGVACDTAVSEAGPMIHLSRYKDSLMLTIFDGDELLGKMKIQKDRYGNFMTRRITYPMDGELEMTTDLVLLDTMIVILERTVDLVDTGVIKANIMYLSTRNTETFELNWDFKLDSSRISDSNYLRDNSFEHEIGPLLLEENFLKRVSQGESDKNYIDEAECPYYESHCTIDANHFNLSPDKNVRTISDAIFWMYFFEWFPEYMWHGSIRYKCDATTFRTP